MTFISSNNSITIEELSSCNYDFRTVASSLVTADTATVDLGGLGTTGSPLTAAVKLSTNVKNLLTTDGTGLLLNSDLLAGFMTGLKVSATDGTSKSYVENIFQAGTNVTINKITTVDGEKLVINATNGSFTLVYADTSTVDLGGTGIIGDPLLASVKISTTAGNALIANSTGLYVPTPSYTGESTLVATDSSTLAFTTSGTAGHSLTAGVKISNTAGNVLAVNGNGLYVPTPVFTQDVLVATDSNSIDFTTSGANGHNLTANLRVSADSGNSLEVRANGVYSAGGANTPITVAASDSIEILTSGTDSHTLTPSLKVSAISGNQASVVADGIYVPEGLTISGTTNYVTKFASPSTVGNSIIFDDGTKVVIGGTTGSSLFNVLGQVGIINTTTHTTGTAAALGISANTIFSGSLPTSNASFSAQVIALNSTFNGATTVVGDTPFGSIISVSKIAFSSTGTVTMTNGGGGLKSISSFTTSTFDDGTINGTVTKTAGIQINGIFKVAGSTATITRTDHYQLLINSSNEFGHGGNITNKWGIYQVGANDTNFFGGQVVLNNLPVYADNAAASSLATGTVYRTATGELRVKY